MTITTDAMLKKQDRSDLIELGMESSVALMSLVNLLRIRPVGVDSKKRNGERRTERSILLCSSVVALMYIAKKLKLAKKVSKPVSIKQVSFSVRVKYCGLKLTGPLTFTESQRRVHAKTEELFGLGNAGVARLVCPSA